MWCAGRAAKRPDALTFSSSLRCERDEILIFFHQQFNQQRVNQRTPRSHRVGEAPASEVVRRLLFGDDDDGQESGGDEEDEVIPSRR